VSHWAGKKHSWDRGGCRRLFKKPQTPTPQNERIYTKVYKPKSSWPLHNKQRYKTKNKMPNIFPRETKSHHCKELSRFLSKITLEGEETAGEAIGIPKKKKGKCGKLK